MNMNWKRLLEGALLSLVPLFSFVFFVYGSQYLISSNKQAEMLLGSISGFPHNNGEVYTGGGDAIVNPGEQSHEDEEESNQMDINAESVISIKSTLVGDDAVIFEQNKNLKLPIASLTKLMTAVIVLDNYNLSQKITVSEKADSQLSMQTDFKQGDIFTIEQFLNVMLIESSNKAAYALSEKLGEEEFVSLMNKKAEDIGLKNTFFVDPTGLSSENISTASDLAMIAEYILKNYSKIAEISTIQDYKLENFGKILNTNQLLAENSEIVLGKTGFTSYANGCLLLVLKNSEDGSYLINVILGADDRFWEMKKLINRQNNNSK